MTKIKLGILMVCVLLALTACSKPEVEIIDKKPDLTQIRNICNLATLECYYHNVAKSTKKAGTGLLNIGNQDREFWIEYTGIARLGIDISRVKMTIEGDRVRILMPNAEIIGQPTIENTSLGEDSFIISEADWFNRNKITAEDQTKAINAAQDHMKATLAQNTALLVRAQSRAETLIENYILQLGEISGRKYKISWDYMEGTGQKSEVPEPEEKEENAQ